MSNQQTDQIVDSLIEKFRSRSEDRIKKYGTTLSENNTDCFLKHAQEEALDLANYLEKLIQDKKSEFEIIYEFALWFNKKGNYNIQGYEIEEYINNKNNK